MDLENISLNTGGVFLSGSHRSTWAATKLKQNDEEARPDQSKDRLKYKDKDKDRDKDKGKYK